jgi:hypothetical protein
MKRVKILLIVVLITITSLIHAQVKKNENVPNDNAQNNQEIVYRLFPTQNMWTFIKLNTRNGEMWQEQYDVPGNNRNETYLNLLPLVTKDEERNGRFTLYPTQNIYTFILLDQFSGKVWQVQWSTEPANRVVVPIE